MQNITFKRYKDRLVQENHLGLGGIDTKNSHRIGVNSRYLTFDGNPWIPVMGEYHFSRDAVSRWMEKIHCMKLGGITIVSTYLFWIYHEEEEGVFQFEGNRDIRGFVEACARDGMYVVIRIGPWCHGECRNGGFPDWILKKDIPLRTNSPEYLNCVRRLFKAYAKELQGLYFKDGGPIICTQVENELVDNPEHLAELIRMAKDCGIVTPLYTVTGWNSDQGAEIPLTGVLPVFSGYCDAPWDPGMERKPTPSMHYFFLEDRNDSAVGADLSSTQSVPGKWRLPYERYPYLTCELGGGLQSTYHRRYIVDPMDVYAMSLVKLGCGNNMPGYYMYCGGTHGIGQTCTLQESRATGYPNDYPILNYDYCAPVSSYGECRPHFGLLNMLHMFLKSWGGCLAPMLPVFPSHPVTVDDTSMLRCCLRTDDRSGFVFVNHYQRLYPLSDVEGAVINTGLGIVFPPIDVRGDIAFLMPFRMKLADCLLVYATAQPLYREENTFFFAAIPGICPEYCFDDGTVLRTDPGFDSVLVRKNVRIVTLPWDKARYMRTDDSGIYVGDGHEVRRHDGVVFETIDAEKSDVYVWNVDAFLKDSAELREVFSLQSGFKMIDCSRPAFRIPEKYAAELQLGGNGEIIWKKMDVNQDKGFVVITEKFDVAQIYVDHELVADKFYDGMPWRIPVTLLDGKDCYLVMTPWKDGICYHEISGK